MKFNPISIFEISASTDLMKKLVLWKKYQGMLDVKKKKPTG